MAGLRRVEQVWSGWRGQWCIPLGPGLLLEGEASDPEQSAQSRPQCQQKDQCLAERSISAGQCRGARAMLGWSQGQLAAAARVSRMTIVAFEVERQVPHANNLLAVRAALEAAGIEFINENGGGPGVRLCTAG